MTNIQLKLADITSLLIKVAADLKGHIDQLRELDAVMGDGDLGVTVEMGSKC